MKNIENDYMHPEYLIETAWLEEHLDVANLRVFDCTVNVSPNPDLVQRKQNPFIYQSGRKNYDKEHIPRAGFIDIPNELSDTSSNLPLMMPSKEKFTQAMERYGIGDDTQVVLYSTTEPNWATRVWWMLRAHGFNNAAILNGGWKKWSKEARPISFQDCTYMPGHFSTTQRRDAFVDKQDVLDSIHDEDVHIINALPSPIHEGTSEFIFGRKGRIVGSVNVPFSSMHDPDSGCYLPADQLQEKFDAVSTKKNKRSITYCGGGIASSNTAFTLALLGHDNVSVYDGSLLEWGNDESLPMEAG